MKTLGAKKLNLYNFSKLHAFQRTNAGAVSCTGTVCFFDFFARLLVDY